MKGEYVEEKDHNNNMFAKLHPIQKFQQQQQQQQQPPPLHPTHHFQVGRECQTSEEADSGGATPSSANKKQANSGDGASIEVSRRPRGRPPGSKNKPKPPVIITRDTEPSMSPYILELAGGVDIVDCMYRFCRKRNMGLCVLTGSGSVANVTLRQPSTTPGATVTFHGRFDILSLSATILPATTTSAVVPSGFVISLAGPQGQIVGGSVVGSLMAAGTVYVVAASFNSPSYHRLPSDDGVGTSGSGGNERGQSPSAVSGGGDGGGGGHPPQTAESCGMSLYSCHLPSNVIWAPTASQPPY
ncbi:AT-hook motif nuclear-localized protein 17-like [Cornus florida]|uniref:AT-hook motif nuclear-localized protein 17-like n=1 Tax=Cornus florida TaxID=4283 RepID=UPI0028A09AE5|nr:AT-hook motif nuclear-localized protein 17-like [Cornus florida]